MSNAPTKNATRERFPWGRIIQIHTVGPYEIVEYAERGADNHPTHPRKETGQTMFHVTTTHLDSWSGESFMSFDQALIGAIDRRVNGNTRAAPYAFRVLGVQ